MSHYVPKLREEDGRDGTQWPTPPGTWKQQEHVSHLATFAEKLDVSKGSTDTDLLNSVPTRFEVGSFQPRNDYSTKRDGGQRCCKDLLRPASRTVCRGG